MVIGRYAPSPSGPQHLGNLQTALCAWLHARLHLGLFLLRIEDIDTPRVVAGCAEQIQSDLQWLGLDWDQEVVYQSARLAQYSNDFARLQNQELVYPCYCSRKDIREASSAPHGEQLVYPGTCRFLSSLDQQKANARKQPCFRFRAHLLGDDFDDFVLKRADGFYAYQLAVVSDDLAQGVTDVVRGEDLRDSAQMQLQLAAALVPETKPILYHHAPLMLEISGHKMSKRDGSMSLDRWRESGKGAEELIAHFGHNLGILDPTYPAISARELLQSVSLDQLGSVLR